VFIVVAVLLAVVPWIFVFIYRLWKARNKLNALLELLGATALIVLAHAVIGVLSWYLLQNYFSPDLTDPTLTDLRFYATFAVPLLVGLLALGGTLIAGLTSRYTGNDDQEWWARAGAWLLIAVMGWIVFNLLVLYVPEMLLGLAKQNFSWKFWTWSKEAFGTLIGIVTGAVTLFGGFSAQTPANDQEAKEAGPGGRLLGAVTSLVAPIFLAFIFVLLATAVNWTLPGDPTDHDAIINGSSGWWLVGVCLALLIIGLLAGLAISTNRFSLHYFWRNRIIRAYLGASNEGRRPHPFTGFDPDDNIQMHEISRPAPTSPRPARLLHVVNVALNLVGGGSLAWQERKAESFTISPLHVGSFWSNLGYRPAQEYGGQLNNNIQGISLGTAVAISGAFASPNMGYMMSSPVVRFIMTLFNLRFGWWLGNPGQAGASPLNFSNWLFDRVETYKRDSPRLSVKPILAEALGMTNDESPYVYLSDGGHFENLGLYEMVLRRCRFIVVADASTDPDYDFGSLAMSIRQIRVDLGIPIEIKKLSIAQLAKEGDGRYCAIGTIRYSCVDEHDPEKKEATDGTLIYLKPALLGDEPRDVLNYARGSSPSSAGLR